MSADDENGLVSANPVHDERGSFRRRVQRLAGSAVVLGGAALKWAFIFGKFFAVFISFAVYSALFHSWKAGLGLVLLIFVHEMGHFIEAKRQGLSVTLPQFVPFFGAYVRIRQAHLPPWNNALVSLAGPFLGSIGAAVCWVAAPYGNEQLLLGLANLGFLLNAMNLVPIGFLDGGQVARAMGQERRGWIRHDENGVPVEAIAPNPNGARKILFLYLLLAAAIVVCLLASKPSGAL
jgi:membrane-associated protease RseP (regulator of RpoE activity)